MPAPKKPRVRVNNFERTVVQIVADKNIGYIDAILEYCKRNEIDPEYCKNLMTQTIKDKIEAEYQALNMLQKPTQLEFDE